MVNTRGNKGIPDQASKMHNNSRKRGVNRNAENSDRLPGTPKSKQSRSIDPNANATQNSSDKRVVKVKNSKANATPQIQDGARPKEPEKQTQVTKVKPRSRSRSRSKSKEKVTTPPEEQLDYNDYDRYDFEQDNVQVGVSPTEEREFDENFPMEEEFDSEDEILQDQGQSPTVTNADVPDCEIEFRIPRQRSSVTKEDLVNDPGLNEVVNRLVEEKVKLALQAKGMDEIESVDPQTMEQTSEQLLAQLNNNSSTPVRNKAVGRSMVKSPSDTTLYTPALSRNMNRHYGLANERNVQKNKEDAMHNISDFIAGIRLEQSGQGVTPSEKDCLEAHTSGNDGGNVNTLPTPRGPQTVDEENAASMEEAKRIAEKMIIEAEQFKASVAPKPSKDNELVGNLTLSQLIDKVKQGMLSDTDDEFFHVTCHLDANLRSKIESGGFVDLEKLLPKTKHQVFHDEKKFQFVYQNGETFFTPQEGENRISSVRKWEQAFRVYATVYCAAHPHRSAEIWQYVFTINKAAMTYSWDNVYYYDVTFRHLMEKYP